MSKATVDQIALSPGSVSSPSIFGTASSNTGFYFIDANTIGITVNGVKIGEFNSSGLSIPTKTAIFEYQVAAGNGGGDPPNANWNTRDLNTTVRDDGNFASISSSTVTLTSGSYIFKGEAVFCNTNTTQLRIRNTTDSVTNGVGFLMTNNTAGLNVTTNVVTPVITISSTKDFQLQYKVQSTNANGLGNFSLTFDEVSVFARLIIEKVA